MASSMTRLDYCQFLLSSQINYTLTYFAEHSRRFSHDIEACQCRRARIQRNHIGCAILVWVRLKALAHQTGNTVYQIKHGMLSQYMIKQLRNPSVRMALA